MTIIQPASARNLAGAETVVQTEKVYGTVTDAVGPVIGAAVKVAASNNGTTTDENGRFELNAEPGVLLVVSCLGYKDQTVVAAPNMQILLVEDMTALDEVVVTALGIKRDRKALGYALSEVSGDELNKAKETNVINSLAGKVAGLIINETAAGPSGSTRVLLRGNTEMTGNNQPLYVVDGVPLDNTNFGSAGTAGGYDLGDGISAINPDDIENMTVLKGPAASALYGSRASHGVILITTKKADKENFSVEYNGSLTLDSQLAKWDNIQQVYGMGYNGDYTRDASSGTNMSWGPKADNFDVTYYDGETRPFYMYKDNTSGFFRLGGTMQNSVIMSTNTGKTGVRFSFTDMRNRDILPNTNMGRDNFNLRVNTSMGKVDLDFTANYTHEDVKNRPALGDSQSNVGKNLMTLAGTYNQSWLQNYENADGTYANWNGLDQYNKNPYWDLYKNRNNTDKDVFRLSGRAIWNVTDHFKIQGTVGTDMNRMVFEEMIYRTTPGSSAGKMESQHFNNNTLNAEILALYNNSWGEWDVTATAGGNIYKVDNTTTMFSGLEQQMDNVMNIMNYAEQSVQEGVYRKQINSLFASASVGFRRTYYLEATLRGDQSSTLPVQNNIYVYPSVSGSWVFSEYLQNKNILSYGKLRASWAQVGSDTDPYQLALNYGTAKYAYPGAVIGMINNSVQPNFDLKPTMTSSYELGLEMKFLNGRVGIDATYYDQSSINQIISLASSSTSGYSARLVNAGEIQNRGIELAVNGRAVQVFLKGIISAILPHARIYDGGQGTARQLNRLLEAEGLLNPSQGSSSVVFKNTLDDESKNDLALYLLEE